MHAVPTGRWLHRPAAAPAQRAPQPADEASVTLSARGRARACGLLTLRLRPRGVFHTRTAPLYSHQCRRCVWPLPLCCSSRPSFFSALHGWALGFCEARA